MAALEEKMVQRLIDYMVARQAATDARRRGEAQPWSPDPIIANKFFCSVVRDEDRTSTEARMAIMGMSPAEREKAVRVFRFVNYVPSLLAVIPVIDHGIDAIEAALRAQPKALNANAYRINTKHGLWDLRGVAELIHKAKDQGTRGRKAQWTWGALTKATSSPFIAYQVMQDMRWIGGPFEDENTWALVGIGAWRGFKRLTGQEVAAHWTERDGDRPKLNKQGDVPFEIRKIMTAALPLAREALGPHINMFEIEHNLCEWDKYERVRTGESPGRGFKPRPDLIED